MVILGSKSPRRKEILEFLGIDFKIYVPDVEEDVSKDISPEEYVLRTATKKGIYTSDKFKTDTVICADTIVVLDNKILEKPSSKEDARMMINAISGRSHQVLTGVYLYKDGNFETFVSKTLVYINKMTPQEIEEYINTKEPYDKAGAYAIQGIFAKYIEKIEGDYYNVMGLPLSEIYKRIK